MILKCDYSAEKKTCDSLQVLSFCVLVIAVTDGYDEGYPSSSGYSTGHYFNPSKYAVDSSYHPVASSSYTSDKQHAQPKEAEGSNEQENTGIDYYVSNQLINTLKWK